MSKVEKHNNMVKLSDLSKEYYKPGEAAKMLNLHVRTIQRYCEDGRLDCFLTDTGRRMVSRDSLEKLLQDNRLLVDDSTDIRKDAIYARVSTHKQKSRGDLDRQIDKVSAFAALRDPHQLTIYTDVASGLNDNRKGLNALFDEIMKGHIHRVFISYKDRLTRFGFNYLKKICDYNNTEIIVMSSEEDNKTIEEELAQDIISIIHSFSGKLYGLRRTVKTKIDQELSDDKDNSV